MRWKLKEGLRRDCATAAIMREGDWGKEEEEEDSDSIAVGKVPLMALATRDRPVPFGCGGKVPVGCHACRNRD